jgi:hypothetical protein
LAWHIGAFSRVDRFPSYEEAVLGKPTEAMDADELSATLDKWMAQHNAKLSPEDRNFIVAELVEE